MTVMKNGGLERSGLTNVLLNEHAMLPYAMQCRNRSIPPR